MRADILTVAQYSNPVSQHEDLVKSVTDINDGHAALVQQVHQREETLHIRLGERGGGLVHDEQTGILRERLGDFHALPIAHAQGTDAARHVDVVNVQRRQDFGGLPPHLPPVDHAEAGARGVAHVDVFGHAQFGLKQ